jgi:hypothetical protein
MCWLAGLAAFRATAQDSRPVQLVVQRTAASQAVLDALRAALGQADAEPELDDAPACEPTHSDRLRVIVRWQRGEPIEVCFVRGAALHRRWLEPAAELDAPAREQLMTLVEAGVAALRSGEAWREPADASPPAEPASAGGPTWLSVDRSASPGDRLQQAEPPREPRSSERQSAAPQPSAADELEVVALPGPARVWQLALGYAGDWLAAAPLHELAALGGVSLSPAWSVTLQLGFGPWSERSRGDAGVQLSTLQLRAAVTGALVLSRLFGFELRAGPGLERLTTRPNAATAARLTEGASTATHLDLLLCAQLGARLRLGGTFWLAIWLGADVALTRREVGFTRVNGEFTRVSEAGHVRPRFDAQLGIFL